MADLEDISRRQGKAMDALLEAFSQHLAEIIRRATAKVTAKLLRTLTFTDGVIDGTAANNRILRKLDQIFADAMDEAGYRRLVEAFVSQFPTQLPFLNEVLDFLHQHLPDVPVTAPFTATDLAVLKSFQISAVTGLESTIEGIGALAMRGTMFSLAGLKFADLTETLSEKFATSVPRAATIAETAVATFYRTATDRAFRVIEDDLPSQEIRYQYAGPDDKRTRPFCHRLLLAKKSYTRAEIGEMSNGQLPNVLISAGGFNCRHQWLMAIDAAAQAKAA